MFLDFVVLAKIRKIPDCARCSLSSKIAPTVSGQFFTKILNSETKSLFENNWTCSICNAVSVFLNQRAKAYSIEKNVSSFSKEMFYE